MTTPHIFQHWIGDSATPGSMSGSNYLERSSPHDRRITIGLVPKGGQEEIEAAVKAAQQAFPDWSRRPAPSRGRFFYDVIGQMRGSIDMIADNMAAETGKTLAEAKGEVNKTIIILEFMAGEGFRSGGLTRPGEAENVLLLTLKRPLGVVGIITPWNFPVAVPTWKIAPAILAGNTVVWKPSPHTPWTSDWIMRAFAQILPPGVLNLVHGEAKAAEALVRHLDVQAISFTGSEAAGLSIYRTAAERGLSRVLCEMGGKNAVVVLPDAGIPRAVQGTIQGAFGSAGQRCTATSRVIVHKEIEAKFTKALLAEALKIKVGPWSDKNATMGALVNDAQVGRMMSAVDQASSRETAGKLLCGGTRIRERELEFGCFFAPTIYGDVSPSDPLFQEEFFGPLLTVTGVTDLDDAIAKTNAVRHGLAASIYTSDAAAVMRFAHEARVGMIHSNEGTPGGEAHIPFGGRGATAIGPREMSEEGVRFFSDEATVFLNYSTAGGSQLTIR